MPIFGVDKLVPIWNRLSVVSRLSAFSRFLQSKHGVEKFYASFGFENFF